MGGSDWQGCKGSFRGMGVGTGNGTVVTQVGSVCSNYLISALSKYVLHFTNGKNF